MELYVAMRFYCKYCSVKDACKYYNEDDWCHFQKALEHIDESSFTTAKGLKQYIASKILELEYILQGELGKHESTHFADMELLFRLYTLINGLLEKQIKLKSSNVEDDELPL